MYIKTKNFALWEDDDNREIYKVMVEKRRSDIYKELLEDLPVEDMSNLTHETTPVMIEEIFTKESNNEPETLEKSTRKSRKTPEGLHLFVLVHGYQATSIDMQEIK